MPRKPKPKTNTAIEEGCKNEAFINTRVHPNVDAEDLRFWLEQGEKQISHLLDAADLIVSRTSTLLSVGLGICIALLGYAMTSKSLDQKAYTAWIAGLYDLGVVIYGSFNLRGFDYWMVGTNPKSLYDLIKTDEQSQLKRFLINQINTCEFRICVNRKINKRRWKRYENAFRMMIAVPVVMFLIYILTSMFG